MADGHSQNVNRNSDMYVKKAFSEVIPTAITIETAK